MAVTVESFIRPVGTLASDWLDDLEEVIENLLTEAQALTDNENAQKAWVYARVYRMIVADQMMRPTTEQADDIKEVRSVSQIRYWETLARGYQREYQLIVGRGQSGDTNVQPVW